MEIEAQMWVLYQDEPYFLQEMTKEYYILYNIHNEPTKVHKNDAHFKPLEIPVFQVGDIVVSKTNYYPDLKGTIIDDTKIYRPYTLDDILYVTPFEIIPVNY